MRTTSIAATLLGLGFSAYAQIASAANGQLSYAVSVPDTTASSGSGDVYFQIKGPSSYSWIGLGSGSQMSGSNMLIIYSNAAGTNITLSPRTASGQSQPSFDSSAQAFLTEGSGIENGMMTANIRCSSCAGQFDITSASAPLIYAARSGSAINDDSTSASISQHGNEYGQLTLNMETARNAANDNAFASGTATTPTSGSGTGSTAAASCVPESQVSGGAGSGSSASGTTGSGSTATASATNTGFPWWNGGSRPTGRPSQFDDNNKAKRQEDSCPAGFVLVGGSNTGNSAGSSFGRGGPDPGRRNMLIAHGVMAGLAFAVFFPLGAISIRLLSFPGLVWFHAGVQIFAYLFYTVAFGMGIYMAKDMERLDEYHPVIGMFLFALIFFMPVLGQLHHRNFKKYQRRTGVSYAHLWTGRLIIPLGIINGGLGFMFADNTVYGPIVYGIVGGIFFIIYVIAVIIGERRRAKNRNNMPPKYDEISMEHQSLRDGAPVNAPRHREYYAGDRK